MPSFEWKGSTRAGTSQEGILLADSRDAAVAVLRRQQIQVTNDPRTGTRDPSSAPACRCRSAASASPSSRASSR